MDKDLKIVVWNANGLLQHRHELQMFLETQKIDVCLISEAHFTNQNYLKIQGYQLYYTNYPHNKARSGSAVIVKESINQYELAKYETEQIQATSIRIRTKRYEITIAAIYCPPKHNLKKLDYSNLLQSLGEKFILGGDYNAKHTHWGSRLITTKGKELYQAVREYDCEFHSTKKPTYWPTDLQKPRTYWTSL